MNYVKYLLLFIFSLTYTSKLAAQEYIFGFDDNLLKNLISRHKSAVEETLVPILKSGRERKLATKTVSRLKRKVIKKVLRGKQKHLPLIDAKLLSVEGRSAGA